MRTEIKKKEQTMMCVEELKLNNLRDKKLNSQTRKTSGITLIALVVTIVVLLILAGITISLVFGSNGVIKKAQEANENTQISQVREQLELAKGPEYIEGNGRYNPDSYFERIEAEGIIGNKDTDVIDNGDGTYEVTTTSGYIFKITLVPSKDNVEDIQIEHIGKIDGPRIRDLTVTKTTNSITVEVETANAEGATYTYYYKKDGEADWKKAEEIKEKTYTFSGLESNVIYNIKVRVEKDRKSAEREENIITGELPEGAVQFSPVEWKDGQASTTITTSETGYTLQYQIGEIGEGSWTNTTSGSVIGNLQHGQIVYGRLFDGTNGSKTANIDVQDLEEPKVNVTAGEITTNSIAVSVGSSDEQWGMPSTPTYNYYIKKSTEGNYPTTANYTGTNTSYTFTGLTQGTKYDVKITTQDKAGNIGTGTLINQTTGEVGGATGGLVEGNIIASNPTWSNGTASITLSKGGNVANNLTIQYQVNGINDNNWITGTNVTGLHHNDTVYARLTDGINNGNYASVDIVDNIKPNATINLSGTSTNTEGSITATVTLKDNESGVNTTASKWVYNTISGAIGENEGSYTGGSFSSGQKITLKATTAGTYYLHVLTIDNAGNKKETISNAVTVEKALVADGSYNDDKGVNTPNLGEGMTPIKWNGSTWIETTGNDPDWYDYGETESTRKWANAKTSDGSMWVWIPRYAYSITSGYHSSSTGNIDVEFMKGLTNETSTGRTRFDNASGQGNWNIHPAFNYGETVSGIWVAKFEASPEGATTDKGNSQYNGTEKKLQVKPGVSSWSRITISNIYDVCKNYNSALNSHMMKNDEWGAVAYLSKSKYGKQNEEVWINNSGSYITGAAGNSASASSNTGTTNDYTSTQGVKASTTGTVHGVYDMSGGAYEHVAAYVNNGDSSLTSYGSSLVNGDSKTKNVYSKASSDNSTNNYNANSSKYGDTVYETSRNSARPWNLSWYGDGSSFPGIAAPFFLRGGLFSNGTNAGVFYFSNDNGDSSSVGSFRPVLVTL